MKRKGDWKLNWPALLAGVLTDLFFLAVLFFPRWFAELGLEWAGMPAFLLWAAWHIYGVHLYRKALGKAPAGMAGAKSTAAGLGGALLVAVLLYGGISLEALSNPVTEFLARMKLDRLLICGLLLYGSWAISRRPAENG
jgi:hypothetical protein